MNWTNPKEQISKYFVVAEALYLPRWDIMHIPTEEEKENILKMAESMDIIREYLEKPITVLNWIRPVAYNVLIGGALKSMHILGKAVDWYCSENCDDIRMLLQFKLAEWNLRMERMPYGNWVHIDNREISNGMQRYFIP
ncbi:hypothetical protein C0389_06855 [bacterium]|nr:hypothetical protein [bacterium]